MKMNIKTENKKVDATKIVNITYESGIDFELRKTLIREATQEKYVKDELPMTKARMKTEHKERK